jgi:hypothetical protein
MGIALLAGTNVSGGWLLVVFASGPRLMAPQTTLSLAEWSCEWLSVRSVFVAPYPSTLQ